MNSIPILFENDEIFVINKASGLASQGGKGISHSVDTDLKEQVGYKIYLVHRLDKETSGLMLVAKNPLSASIWTKLISSKDVKKEYLAVCYGKLKNKKGQITEELEQHGQKKTAKTFYSVEKEVELFYDSVDENGEAKSSKIELSLVRLVLETGRMHQIRIHLAKNNCPIVGDDLHGNFKINKLLKKYFKVKNLQLAAVKLTVPLNGKQKIFEIPLPETMDKLINYV